MQTTSGIPAGTAGTFTSGEGGSVAIVGALSVVGGSAEVGGGVAGLTTAVAETIDVGSVAVASEVDAVTATVVIGEAMVVLPSVSVAPSLAQDNAPKIATPIHVTLHARRCPINAPRLTMSTPAFGGRCYRPATFVSRSWGSTIVTRFGSTCRNLTQ
jgi:hypothetical protein